MKENCRLLIDTICQMLRDGFEADGKLIGYIDALFSCPSIFELAQVIDDDTDPERDGLLELIFFPDENIQKKIEEALGDVVFSPEDLDTVTGALSRRRLQTTLFFSDGRGTLPIDFPRGVIQTFLQRLNLTKKIDAELMDSVAAHIAPSDQTAVRVKLRNFRKHLDAKKVQFLAVFFEKTGSDAQFFAYLDFMLDVLEDIEADADVFEELTQRRQACRHQLQQTAVFEERLQRDNIETLMMRGERAAHLPKHELLKKLAFIDSICLSVFGKLAAAPREIQDSHGFAFQSADDLQDLVRRFLYEKQ
jgi:hypothetical protein